MITFFTIKLLLITAIFAKAWLDVEGNKNQLDHIITPLYEVSLIFVAVIMHYFYYASPILAEGYMVIPAYILLRYAFFDMLYNKIAGHNWDYLGSNNWEDKVKVWMRNIERNKRIPILSASRFMAGFFGILM
jgi:hypothetical protein